MTDAINESLMVLSSARVNSLFWKIPLKAYDSNGALSSVPIQAYSERLLSA